MAFFGPRNGAGIRLEADSSLMAYQGLATMRPRDNNRLTKADFGGSG